MRGFVYEETFAISAERLSWNLRLNPTLRLSIGALRLNMISGLKIRLEADDGILLCINFRSLGCRLIPAVICLGIPFLYAQAAHLSQVLHLVMYHRGQLPAPSTPFYAFWVRYQCFVKPRNCFGPQIYVELLLFPSILGFYSLWTFCRFITYLPYLILKLKIII